MEAELQYVLGFFVPIVVAGAAGFLAGRYYGRKQGDAEPKLIEVKNPVVTLVADPAIETEKAATEFIKQLMGTPRDPLLAEEMEAVVTLVIPEYGHAKVLTTGRRQFSIGARVEGVEWNTLKIGEKLKINVVGGIVKTAVRL